MRVWDLRERRLLEQTDENVPDETSEEVSGRRRGSNGEGRLTSRFIKKGQREKGLKREERASGGRWKGPHFWGRNQVG